MISRHSPTLAFSLRPVRRAARRGAAVRSVALSALAALLALAPPAPLASAQEPTPPDEAEAPAGAGEAAPPAAGEDAAGPEQTAAAGVAPAGSAPAGAVPAAGAPPGRMRVVDVRRYEPAEEIEGEPDAPAGAAATRDGRREADEAEDGAKARLGQMIALRVEGFDPLLAAAGSCDEIMLYLEGMPLEGNRARSCDPEAGEVRFRLTRDEQDDPDWHALLGSPSSYVRQVRVSLGTGDRQPLRSSAVLELVVLPRGVLWAFGVALLLGAALFVRLARRTDMLRDRQAHVPPGHPRPYSLARVQMAWWFALVVAAYVFIWLVLGELDTITESILALIGIGSGTALGAAMIDGQKKQAERQAAVGAEAARATAAAAAASPDGVDLVQAVRAAQIQAEAAERAGSNKGAARGFLADVLSDGEGISFHRFQMLTWTVVLGFIFVASVYGTLQMPEFSATLLALMGISNGTYLGFKFPERFAAGGAGGAPPPDGPPEGGPPEGAGGPAGGEPEPAEPPEPPSEPASERVLAG